jgi:acyl carrier protein
MDIVEDRIRDILIEDLFLEMDKENILATHSLRDDLGLDSVGFVELRTQVEKRFSIVVSDDEFTPANFATISSLTGLIHRRGGSVR